MLAGKNVNARFTEQAAQTARLMLYGLLAVVLMAMDQRGQYVPRFRTFANYLVEPVYTVVEWPVRALRGVFGFFQGTQALRRENSDLERLLLQQEGELQRLNSLVEENARLRALVDGSRGQQFDFQFAELVDVDLDPFSHRVIIDRGADKGIMVGQAVLDGAGVMGQVEAVALHNSTVRLISDPNHALPVQINRTGLRGIAFGTGTTARLEMPSVPHEADVRVGDLVVTSGLGGRFPGGYPVATVTRVDRQEGQTFARVEAAPLAALDRGREVLLIKSLPPPEEEAPEVSTEENTDEISGEAQASVMEAETEIQTTETQSAETQAVEIQPAENQSAESEPER